MGKNINVVSSNGGRTGSWTAKLPGGTIITTMSKTLYDSALREGGKKLIRSGRDGTLVNTARSVSNAKQK